LAKIKKKLGSVDRRVGSGRRRRTRTSLCSSH